MELTDILNAVSVINRDNGKQFKETERIDAITSLLWDSKYRRINAEGLFILYASKPLNNYKDRDAVVVTSHIDCERNITRCFSQRDHDGMMKGTYDNAVTNAVITYLMMKGSLPDDILIAFTGDEEVDSRGAAQLANFLEKRGINVRHIFVLDVTDMGWNEAADFTIENNFWNGDCGRAIVEAAQALPYNWRFVPSDCDDVPYFVPKEFVIDEEAEADESWELDELDINCCSLCIPVKGEMHSNLGVLMRESSLYNYADAVERIIKSC